MINTNRNPLLLLALPIAISSGVPMLAYATEAALVLRLTPHLSITAGNATAHENDASVGALKAIPAQNISVDAGQMTNGVAGTKLENVAEAQTTIKLNFNQALLRATTQSANRQKEILDIRQLDIDRSLRALLYKPSASLQTVYQSTSQAGAVENLAANRRSSGLTNSLSAELRTPLGGSLKSTLSTSQQQSNTNNKSNNAALELSQPLLRGAWSAGRFDENLNKVTDMQQVFLLQKNRNAYVQLVANAFLNVYSTQRQLVIARASIDRTIESNKINEALYEAGRIPKLSLSAGAANLSRAKLQLREAENQVSDVQRSFLLLLGYEQIATLELELPDRLTPPNTDSLEELIQKALDNRIEIKAAQAEVQSAQLAVDKAKNNLLPKLDVSIKIERPILIGEPKTPINRSIGLTLELPLTRGEINAAKSTAQINFEKVSVSLEDTRRAVESEVRQLYSKSEALRATRLLVNEYLISQRQQLGAELEKFRSGRANATDMRNSEDALKEAELSVLNLKIDEIKFQFDLVFATGTEKSVFPDFVLN